MNLRLLLIIFLSTTAATSSCKQSLPSTIFALEPLTMGHSDPTFLQIYTPYLQSAALPLAACFFYAINKNNVHADLTQNPYTTALLLYITLQYSLHAMQEYQQRTIDVTMKETLQEIFYLLVIGHGIRNSIMQQSSIDKRSFNAIYIDLKELEFFLHKTHDLWISLFLEYEADAKHQPIYIYKSNKIELFDVLQASSHDHDLMNLMANCYLKNSYAYDYHAIVQHLEKKFILLSHQFMQIKMQIG